MKLISQLGQLVAEHDKRIYDLARADASKKVETAVTSLRDSAPEHANTLSKLYGLMRQNRNMYICENNVERMLLDKTTMVVGDQVFVRNDGDGEWAFYMLLGKAPNLVYEKTFRKGDILDPLNSVKIKVLYESNPDTNVFTDAEKKFIGSLVNGTAELKTKAKESYASAINELVETIKVLDDTVQKQAELIKNIELQPTDIGTIDDFVAGYGEFDSSLGTLEDFISGFESVDLNLPQE